VIIDNSASNANTVIEVNGRDRPGFLYDVTTALTELNLQISTAKIATFGTRAVDVFYVKDLFGLKVTHEKRLAAIRERLLAAIGSPDGKPCAPADTKKETKARAKAGAPAAKTAPKRTKSGTD
jgi:[protein-PII] uridylyltransferase